MDMGGTGFLIKENETPDRRAIISAVIALSSILVAIRSPLEENNGAGLADGRMLKKAVQQGRSE